MTDHFNSLVSYDKLNSLIQKDNFVGWVYSIDYDSAFIVTNDLWKRRVSGIPHNCFLVAATFDPERYAQTTYIDKEVVLLRVVGTAKLPQDDDVVRTKIDNFQNQTEVYLTDPAKDFDYITKNMIQFGGLECRVLGTFYYQNNELYLGSDMESFSVSSRLNVYRPKGEALETIVNYVDPIRKANAFTDAKELGLLKPIAPLPIGTVRYTSTDRLHRHVNEKRVPFFIQPSDFLARRTAVLGMTRTGKSNMIKQTVSVVKRISDDCDVKIGQIIYDINGEYANANQQDKGAISEIYASDTVRYRMIKTEGFKELQNNFYLQLQEGFTTICNVIRKDANISANDVKIFMNMSLDEPDKKDRSLHMRWEVKVAAYRTMLYKAGYECDFDLPIKFSANKNIREAVNHEIGNNSLNPSKALTFSEAEQWFMALRVANKKKKSESSGKKGLESSSGKAWVDDELEAILNMMACKNEKDAYINGYKVIGLAKQYHSPRRKQEVAWEIYEYLLEGKIVILDLSVGDAKLRKKISEDIAQSIFDKSMQYFLEAKTPPNIVVYIEEAHNLIGKNMELTETWPRLAKEGAKYKIALVYATQEVSSVHPNILANTENWFVSHLNNEKEIRVLASFYDFSDFSRSILRAQDVGFTRVKTLSSPFVVPVQIDKFDPEKERKRRE